jgi:hypothetical protein
MPRLDSSGIEEGAVLGSQNDLKVFKWNKGLAHRL